MVVFIFGNNAWGDAGADPEAVPGNFNNNKKIILFINKKSAFKTINKPENPLKSFFLQFR